MLEKFIDQLCRLFQFLMVACLALMVGGEAVPWPLKDKSANRKVRDLVTEAELAMSSPIALRDAALAGIEY